MLQSKDKRSEVKGRLLDVLFQFSGRLPWCMNLFCKSKEKSLFNPLVTKRWSGLSQWESKLIIKTTKQRVLVHFWQIINSLPSLRLQLFLPRRLFPLQFFCRVCEDKSLHTSCSPWGEGSCSFAACSLTKWRRVVHQIRGHGYEGTCCFLIRERCSLLSRSAPRTGPHQGKCDCVPLISRLMGAQGLSLH